MNPTCDKPGCGLEMEPDEVFHLRWVCPRNADAHALAAKLAESEAKVRELEEGDEALLAVLPEDFGAVEYIKHLTAANAALEAKLCRMVDLAGEADDTMRERNFYGAQAILQIVLTESRKKGAEHE